ncbi:enoyl-CoA hydratase/isomerase family protein [Compostibacter hankyongensis]|uniref:Enoyl-CoA hydratase-related protein n=1 Tax=Compostibacter hankyongensis TaxID=1007089 RepID=A0ABP8FFU5_9BACT
MPQELLLTGLREGIYTITLNRPEKLNALNRQLIAGLGRVMEEVYRRPDIRAVLITGAGEKAFAAGADIAELASLDVEAATALARSVQQDVFDKIENCPKPVVAAVNGYALGGGCELAMACHFRTAAETARFGQPEAGLGLIPGYGGTQRLTRLAGKGRAMEMMMSGGMIDAATAERWGLVNHIYPPGQLLDASLRLLEKIRDNAPPALGRIIGLVNAASLGDAGGFDREIAAFGACFGTPEMQEGTRAFLEKRKPKFDGGER